MHPSKTAYLSLRQTLPQEQDAESATSKTESRRDALVSTFRTGLIVLLALTNLALVIRLSHVTSHTEEELPPDFGKKLLFAVLPILLNLMSF